MSQVFKLIMFVCGFLLLVGCSSNDDDDGNVGGSNSEGTDPNGSANDGSDSGDSDQMNVIVCSSSGTDASALNTIGSQLLESDPVALDIAGLSNTLNNLANGCVEADPTSVNQGDTAIDILTRINSSG